MVTFTVETSHDEKILRCSGRVVVGRGYRGVQRGCHLPLKQHAVVLDLTNVTTVDAGGLGLLVSLAVRGLPSHDNNPLLRHHPGYDI